MKIQQETLPFRPITVKLEKQEEAEAFFSLMDKLCRVNSFEAVPIKPGDLTPEERKLAAELSDALTECKVRL